MSALGKIFWVRAILDEMRRAAVVETMIVVVPLVGWRK
jgi:hypothetical protein